MMIDKMVEEIKELTSYYSDCTKHGNKNAEQQAKSYGITLNYEVADLVEEIIAIAEKYKSQEPRWISVEERLPEEFEMIFENQSNNVCVACELEDGKVITSFSHTVFGKWKIEKEKIVKHKVIAWMPIPEYIPDVTKKEGGAAG